MNLDTGMIDSTSLRATSADAGGGKESGHERTVRPCAWAKSWGVTTQFIWFAIAMAGHCLSLYLVANGLILGTSFPH